MRMVLRVGAVCLGLAAGGCDGVIGDPSASGEVADDGPLGSTGRGLDCSMPAAGEALTRRLTAREYRNTMRDLLGIVPPADLSLPPDSVQGGFYSNDRDIPTRAHVESYWHAARALSVEAMSRLDALLPCTTADEACARELIETLGPRAYRRPLDAAEVDSLLALYRVGAERSFEDGIRLVLEAMLQSPFLLYRFESGVGGAAEGSPVDLTAYEIASRLSYFLWSSMPDDALFAAAADGSLTDPDVVRAHAARMLDDPKARDGFLAFFTEWLLLGEVDAIEKDPELFPLWQGAAQSAEDEVLRFVQHVMEDGDATLASLFMSRTAFVDAAAARLYEVEPPADGEVVEVELDPSRRAGILTRPAVLAAWAKGHETSPILRGAFVRRQLFCYEVPAPPDDVDTEIPEVEGATLRERLAMHRTDPVCANCHELMDPIGFALEHYDASGAWRDTEEGRPVDASGELKDTDVDGPIDGGIELSERLARSRDASDCATAQVLRFALGRSLSSEDLCVARELADGFAASGGDFRTLFVEVAASRALRTMAADPTRASLTGREP